MLIYIIIIIKFQCFKIHMIDILIYSQSTYVIGSHTKTQVSSKQRKQEKQLIKGRYSRLTSLRQRNYGENIRTHTPNISKVERFEKSFLHMYCLFVLSVSFYNLNSYVVKNFKYASLPLSRITLMTFSVTLPFFLPMIRLKCCLGWIKLSYRLFKTWSKLNVMFLYAILLRSASVYMIPNV